MSRRTRIKLCSQIDQVKNGVFVLGATTKPWQLESIILKRFSQYVHIALPDLLERVTIFRIEVAAMQHTLETEDFKKLGEATEGYSASDIHSVVQAAFIKPIRKVKDATHFKQVIPTLDLVSCLTPIPKSGFCLLPTL